MYATRVLFLSESELLGEEWPGEGGLCWGALYHRRAEKGWLWRNEQLRHTCLLAHDVTDTDCMTQNGSAHSHVSGTFKRRFLTK